MGFIADEPLVKDYLVHMPVTIMPGCRTYIGSFSCSSQRFYKLADLMDASQEELEALVRAPSSIVPGHITFMDAPSRYVSWPPDIQWKP